MLEETKKIDLEHGTLAKLYLELANALPDSVQSKRELGLQAELTALREELERHGQGARNRLRIVEQLTIAYRADPVSVAGLCDEVLDRSGALLGWLREAAREAV